MPNPTPGDVIERELLYGLALGVVLHFKVQRQRGGYRRYVVTTSDGLPHTWTPAQVLAFGIGVRLATERKGT
jgi:hypothetical protein